MRSTANYSTFTRQALATYYLSCSKFKGYRIEFKFIKHYPDRVEWEQLPYNRNRVHYIRYESIMLKSSWNEINGTEVVSNKFLSSFNLNLACIPCPSPFIFDSSPSNARPVGEQGRTESTNLPIPCRNNIVGGAVSSHIPKLTFRTASQPKGSEAQKFKQMGHFRGGGTRFRYRLGSIQR